jgi:thiol-disulfide isomerase/thioredoxin
VIRFAIATVFCLGVSAAPGLAQTATTAPPTLIASVRQAIADKDFVRGDALLSAHRKERGLTSEWLAARSWIARAQLAEKNLDAAERVADEVYTSAEPLLTKGTLDRDANLQTAVGAAIEVLSQVDAARGARSEAVTYLRSALATYKGSTIEKRIQKNLNLLSLEGTTAPPLEMSEYIGAAPPPLPALKGKVVLLFFWAHWCSDCKSQGPILAELATRYAADGLVVVAPTQRFGYVAGGKEAPPDVEMRYIEEIRQTFYPDLAARPIPVSETNHRRYGVSSTPTLVLVDRAGVVRLYNPGKMTREALEPQIQKLLGPARRTSDGS